jgi:hypothetical protein
MMSGMIIPKYKIDDRVYYNLAEGEEGIVLDICYYYASKQFSYLIGLDFVTKVWVFEKEISDEKQY